MDSELSRVEDIHDPLENGEWLFDIDARPDWLIKELPRPSFSEEPVELPNDIWYIVIDIACQQAWTSKTCSDYLRIGLVCKDWWKFMKTPKIKRPFLLINYKTPISWDHFAENYHRFISHPWFKLSHDTIHDFMTTFRASHKHPQVMLDWFVTMPGVSDVRVKENGRPFLTTLKTTSGDFHAIASNDMRFCTIGKRRYYLYIDAVFMGTKPEVNKDIDCYVGFHII